MTAPSIWILRKPTDEFPDKSGCKDGDLIVLSSGDILVFIDQFWDLLPGRYLDTEELKEFISYVRGGWPESSEIVRDDLTGKLRGDFVDRMCGTVEKINRTN